MLTMYKVISWFIFLSSYIVGIIYFFNHNNPEFMYFGLISVFSYLLGIILLIESERLTKLSNNVLIFIVRFFYSLYQGFVTNDYWLLCFLLILIVISYFSVYYYLILVSGIKKIESY